jgi:GNAT superfamily N-acetyltransferase
VSNRLERVEAEAFADVIEAAGLPTPRVAGAVCCAVPGSDSPTLNRAIALGLERPPSDAELDEIDVFFREAGVRYSVPIAPDVEASLEPRLRERGFTTGYAWMKFSRGVEPAAMRETQLEIESTEDGDAFSRVVAAAFGLPPELAAGWRKIAPRPDWHLFLARDDDEPVAAAALFVHAGVGWFGAAGTLPEHRGRGAQGALLAARIDRARELGADAVVTETGERLPDRPSNSYRNILRAGFAEAYLRPNLVSPE